MPHRLTESALFESAFRDAAVGMALVALDGRWLEVNDALCSLVGYSREELLKRDFQSITHPDDLNADLAETKQLLEGEVGKYSLEKRYLHKSGRAVPILLSASLVRDDDGRPQFFISQMQDLTARRAAEEASAIFFERSREPMAIAGGDRLDRVNQAWVDLLGWSREHLTSTPFLDFVHPDDREATIAEAQAVFAGNPTRGFKNRYCTAGGGYRWLEWSTTPTTDGKLLCVVRDVTHELEVELSRQKSEQQRAQGLLFTLGEKLKSLDESQAVMNETCAFLSEAFAASHSHYLEIDLDRIQPIWGNTSNEEGARAELPTENFLDMQRGKAVVVEDAATDPRTASRFERLYGPHELAAYVAVPLMRDEKWTALMLVAWREPRSFSAHEVGLIVALAERGWAKTEHLRMLGSLRASEAQYRRIVENMQEGIWEIDGSGVAVFVNRRLAEMLGYEPSELLGKPALSFLDDEMKVVLQSEGARRRAGQSGSYDLRILRRDGSSVWTHVESSPLFDANGHFAGAVALVADISERRAAEEALRRVNEQLEQRVQKRTELLNRSLEEKEILLREIHHRVKNNLQVICSLLNLQAMQTETPALVEVLQGTQDRVRSIAKVHERLYGSTSVDDMLFSDYARALASDLCATYSAAARRISVHVAPSDVRVSMDIAVSCGLIVNELIVNALKHAFTEGEGGTITIAFSRVGSEIELAVADDGVGIPEAIGRGARASLGLELVDTLADQLGAKLTIRRSRGTEVLLRFPEEK